MNVERVAAVVLGLAAPVALGSLAASCGARTGLLLGPSSDAGLVSIDDVALPGLDVTPRDVTPLAICADASDTLIYVVTTDPSGTNYQILRFDPPSAQFTAIAPLVCPDPYSPFSMAVDRVGNAYVLYYAEFQAIQGQVAPPGNVYRVNLNTGACAATTYVPNEAFQSFGMGFARNDIGTAETLFVATNNNSNEGGVLGAIDETSLALTTVGAFSPPVIKAELTGTGDGRLYAFWAPGGSETVGSAISEIDKGTARVVAQSLLPTVTQGGGWAFAFWGGDFYLFTNPAGLGGTGNTESSVQRYDPVSGAVDTIASYPQTIVGAGVSTCAPEQ